MVGRRLSVAACAAVAAAGLVLAAAPWAGAAKPVALAPGQAIAVAGTDIACVFGGPQNQIGIACLHTGSSGTYSFRLDEKDLRVYARKDGKTKEVGRWLEPKTVEQPRSPDVPGFKLVASLQRGDVFSAAGLDLLCEIDSTGGKPVAVCAKAVSGRAIVGSYGISLGPAGVMVAKYGSGSGYKLVFRGSEGK